MNTLIIFSLCTLATIKVALQSRFGKKFLKARSSLVLFNGIVFLTAAILFCTDIPKAALQTWLFSAVFSVFTVIFQLTYTNALSIGNVSLTVMMVNLSMLFPVAVSLVFYGEPLTPTRVLGIALTIISFTICVDRKEQTPVSRKWLLLAISAALANAGIGITQKIFGASEYHLQKESFVACSYGIAFLITMAIYFVTISREKRSDTPPKKSIYAIAISVGIVLAIFQWLNTYAISIIDGSLLFPTYSGGAIIMSTVAGIIFFKDKLSLKQGISITVGIIAVIIMNL